MTAVPLVVVVKSTETTLRGLPKRTRSMVAAPSLAFLSRL